MGFMSFVKGIGSKILGGVQTVGKFLGEHVAPIVHGIANVVQKVAPYAAGAAGALGMPEFAAPIAAAGRIAGTVKNATGG